MAYPSTTSSGPAFYYPPTRAFVPPSFHNDSKEQNFGFLPPVVGPAGYKIRLKGKGLDRKDGPLMKSDPYFILKRVKHELYKSEVKIQTLDPYWDEFELGVEACGGMEGEIHMDCYDWDDDGGHDFIGSVVFSLKELIHLGNVFKLHNPKVSRAFYKHSGKITVELAEPLNALTAKKAVSRAYLVHFRAENLDRRDLTSKTDAYLQLVATPLPGYNLPLGTPYARSFETVVVARTEVVTGNQNPAWEAFEIITDLVGGYETTITAQVFDWDAKGLHGFIGSTSFSLRDLNKKSPQFPLINPAKATALNKGSGILHVVSIKEISNPKYIPMSPYTITIDASNLDAKDASLPIHF